MAILLLHVSPPATIVFSNSSYSRLTLRSPEFMRRVRCRISDSSEVKSVDSASKLEYKRGILDDFFMRSFRNKLIQEVGSDSEKPGYTGLIELVKLLLLKGRTRSETNDAAVRILKSLFPPLILELYKLLIAPLAQGKIAAFMVARVTVLTCQWLMGPCKVNIVDLPNGESWDSGVFVEKCQYLEESKCVGVCTNTCKLPTQTFFKDYMGVPLLMEPNFKDYSCQFKFGVAPPEDDGNVNEPCLETCSIAGRRKIVSGECPMS
uniref:Beta-carotene isomerase D27, chloroplastic n=1 Tax=Noccaea caerulescens TaxID=107243 RepID=A0A1J3GVE6_NOCCA